MNRIEPSNADWRYTPEGMKTFCHILQKGVRNYALKAAYRQCLPDGAPDIESEIWIRLLGDPISLMGATPEEAAMLLLEGYGLKNLADVAARKESRYRLSRAISLDQAQEPIIPPENHRTLIEIFNEFCDQFGELTPKEKVMLASRVACKMNVHESTIAEIAQHADVPEEDIQKEIQIYITEGKMSQNQRKQLSRLRAKLKAAGAPFAMSLAVAIALASHQKDRSHQDSRCYQQQSNQSQLANENLQIALCHQPGLSIG